MERRGVKRVYGDDAGVQRVRQTLADGFRTRSVESGQGNLLMSGGRGNRVIIRDRNFPIKAPYVPSEDE